MKVLICCLPFIVSVCLSQPAPSVNLPLGIVEGFVKETVTGRKFIAFEGVPYAQPPVGKYRFKRSVPRKPWMGVWKANTMHFCTQYYHHFQPKDDMLLGDEDCLYVNIYTPNTNPKKKFNVLVFIHGGAFMWNWGGVYQPDIILDRDIVYVNFNYRLGPLGFLSTEDDEVPGNDGLRDQILALKWIKQNIEHFGGDPNSITISGMSAGGASVEFHHLFKESRGLFLRGISQSGCVINPWVIMEKPLEKTQKLSNIVGCPTNDNKLMIECLRGKPARQIIQSVREFQPFLYNPFSPFGAVVDTWAKDPLLPQHPYKLLLEKKVHDIPWMISYTSAEGLYPGSIFYTNEYMDYIDKNWNEVIPAILHFNDVVPENRMDSVSQKIRDEYLKGEKLTRENFHLFIKAISDRIFVDDIEKAARLHNSAIKSPVYSYYFAYKGAYRNNDNYTDDVGVSHSDDTSYILQTSLQTLTTAEDRQMSKIMVDMFISFMETGKPNITADWRPQPKSKSSPWVQLHISSPQEMFMEEISEDLGNRAFWKSLNFYENENLFKSHDEL